MKTWPHSVHSLSAVSSLLMVGVSRSVRAAAAETSGQGMVHIQYTYNPFQLTWSKRRNRVTTQNSKCFDKLVLYNECG